MATKQGTENKSKLYTVYGARISKSGERVNVSLVDGKGDSRTWACVSLKIGDGERVGVKVYEKEGFAFLKVPLLKEDKPKAKPKTESEDIPF